MQTQSNDKMLTRKQFEHIKRILSKARQALELAEVVKNILFDHITLVEETSSADGIDQELVPCNLNCADRLDLVKWTLTLLQDYASRPEQVQLRDQRGSDSHIELASQLKEQLT